MPSKIKSITCVATLCSALLVLSLAIIGCESTSTSDEGFYVYIQGTEESSAEVTAGEYDAVYLEASVAGTNEVYYPLVWSVNNSHLGTITRSAGLSATYESTGQLGNNVITAKDQAGQEGIAIIECKRPEEEETDNTTE